MQTGVNKQIFSFGNNQICHREQHYEQILLLKLQIVRLTQINRQLTNKQNTNEDVINKINTIERNLNQQLKFKEDRIQQLNIVIKNLHFQCHEKNQRIENLKSNYKQLQQTYLKQASQLRALSAYSAKQQLAQKNLTLFQHYQCKIRQALKEKEQEFTSLIQKTQNTHLQKEKQILYQKQAREDLSARILELQRQVNTRQQEQQIKKKTLIQHENKINELQKQLVNKEAEYKQQVQKIMKETDKIMQQKMILEQKLNEGFNILLRRETKIRELTESLNNQIFKNKEQTQQIQSIQRKLQKKFKIQSQQAIVSIKKNILQQYYHKENKLQQQLLSFANTQSKLQNSEKQLKQQLIEVTQQLREKNRQIEMFKQKCNSLQAQKQQTQFQWKQLLKQTARQRNIIENMHYQQNNAQTCSYNDVQKQENIKPLIYAMKKNDIQNKVQNLVVKKQEIEQTCQNNSTNKLQGQVIDSSYIEQKYEIQQKSNTPNKLQKISYQYKEEQMRQNQIQRIQKFSQAYNGKPIPNIRNYVEDLKHKYSFERDVEHIPKVSINKNMECQQCLNRKSIQISSNEYNNLKENSFSFAKNSQDIDYYIKKKKQLIFNKSNSITLLRNKCDRTLIHNFDSNSSLRLNTQNRSKSYQHISQNKFTNSSLTDNFQGSRQLHSMFSTKNVQADNNRMIKCQPYLDYDTSKQQFLQKLVYSKGWKDNANKQNTCLLRKQSNCMNNIINKLEGNKQYLNLSKGRKMDRKNYKLKIYDKQNQ